ncbi:hypothetical protein NFI96_032032 [Prochilodus magdalenae]|nr:hypothetical protein NFI96_032032 [Prochilodus magdalenae]
MGKFMRNGPNGKGAIFVGKVTTSTKNLPKSLANKLRKVNWPPSSMVHEEQEEREGSGRKGRALRFWRRFKNLQPAPGIGQETEGGAKSPGSSSSEGLDRLWPDGSPNEVSFLHFKLKTSTPRAPQEQRSVGPVAGDTGQPPDPRTVRVKEEQDREDVSPVPGLTLSEAQRVWRNAAHPALQNKHKDLSWMAAHEILPVRAVMHSRGMASNPMCPRPGCGEPETVRHVLWECSVARDLWAITGPLQCPSLPAGEVQPSVYRVAVNGVGQGIEKLPAAEFTALWLTLNGVKAALWTSRNLLVGKRVTVPLHALTALVTSSLQGTPHFDIRRRGLGSHAGGSKPPRSLVPVEALATSARTEARKETLVPGKKDPARRRRRIGWTCRAVTGSGTFV